MKQAHFWLDENEQNKLKTLSIQSGRSMSAVVRSLINEAAIREMPPIEYHKLVSELHRIGVNLNQIALVANATGNIDRDVYRKQVDDLRRAVLEIRQAVELR